MFLFDFGLRIPRRRRHQSSNLFHFRHPALWQFGVQLFIANGVERVFHGYWVLRRQLAVKVRATRLLPTLLLILVGISLVFPWFHNISHLFAQNYTTTNINDRKTGSIFSRRLFRDDAGNPHNYVIFVPNGNAPASKSPILFFLNGLGENGDDGVRQISNNFGLQIWENRELFPFIAIAPQCRAEGRWEADRLDTKWALQILDHVIEEFSADADRVFLTGVSSGGAGVWNIASAYPDRFAAILPLCGVGGDAQKLAVARMPIWNVYNDGDAADLVDSNRTVRQRLIEQGNSPIVSEYHAGGHDCWNRAYRTTALYGWLLEQSRLKNQQARLFQYFPPERLLAEWQRSKDGAWEIGEEDVIIGHGSETSARSELTSNAFGSAFELHGDVWLQGETECRIGFLADDSASQSWWVSVVTTDQGTGGLVSESGEWLSGLDPAAQNTLRAGAWNDVRVQLADGQITVRLNGWPALDARIDSKNASGAPVKYRCALAAPENDSEIRWRFIRTRFTETPPAEQDHP